jgi:hypothetical protein
VIRTFLSAMKKAQNIWEYAQECMRTVNVAASREAVGYGIGVDGLVAKAEAQEKGA